MHKYYFDKYGCNVHKKYLLKMAREFKFGSGWMANNV